MKELYKPVFWCGFALSLSALYASSERFASGSDEPGTIRKPVLLQISFGQATNETVDSTLIDRNQQSTGETFVPPPEVPSTPVPIETTPDATGLYPIDEPAEPPQRNSVFYKAATEALKR